MKTYLYNISHSTGNDYVLVEALNASDARIKAIRFAEKNYEGVENLTLHNT